MLERLAKGKHSNLLDPLVNKEENKVFGSIFNSVTRLGEILLFVYFLLEHIFTFSAK
jgi:hypothetical protein